MSAHINIYIFFKKKHKSMTGKKSCCVNITIYMPAHINIFLKKECKLMTKKKKTNEVMNSTY